MSRRDVFASPRTLTAKTHSSCGVPDTRTVSSHRSGWHMRLPIALIARVGLDAFTAAGNRARTTVQPRSLIPAGAGERPDLLKMVDQGLLRAPRGTRSRNTAPPSPPLASARHVPAAMNNAWGSCG